MENKPEIYFFSLEACTISQGTSLAMLYMARGGGRGVERTDASVVRRYHRWSLIPLSTPEGAASRSLIRMTSLLSGW